MSREARKEIEDIDSSGVVAQICPLLANLRRCKETRARHRGAVEASGTVGEISDAMRRVYGEYKEKVVI